MSLRTLSLIGACLLTGVASAETVTLTAARDNTLYQSLNGLDRSNAVGSYIFSGRTAVGERRRALVEFDLSSIPSGSTINSVTLRMTVDRGAGGGVSFKLHRVTTDWGQGTSNAFEPGGNGAAATPDDPTWVYSHYNTESWTTPGGDFVATESSSCAISELEAYDWTSTAAMVADVQGWLTNPAENHGWVLIGNESVSGGAIRLSSLEGVAPPTLTVTFTPGNQCGTSDFNGDGDSGTDADIEAFFACLAGDCCGSCFELGSDFNADGDAGTDADIEAFFRVLAGQDC